MEHKPAQEEAQENPPLGSQHSGVPCASAAPYREYVDDPAQSRQSLRAMVRQSPALLPHNMEQGGTFHDANASVKQSVIVRQIRGGGQHVFAQRAAAAERHRGRAAAIETARSRQPWGGPFAALASVVGRDAMCSSRAWLAVGRPSLVGTTVKDSHQGPRELGADAPLPRVAKQQVSVPPTVGGGGFLGVHVVAQVPRR